MKHCKDCEPAQELHWVAYTSVVVGWLSQPFYNFMDLLFRNVAEAVSNRVTLPFLKICILLGLGHWNYKPEEKNSLRAKCFWEEAIRRGINMKEFRMGPIGEIFLAEYRGRTITFDGLPRPEGGESDAMNWMDNKGIMKEKFMKEGIPVAQGGVAYRTKTALKIFDRIRKPVITKPNLGSRSRHTMIHLNTKEDLLMGFRKAKKLSPFVIVEEELNGYLFRGTLIGGKLAGVVRRDQPEVVGDGVTTLRDLWKKENERPLRKGPIFHEIVIDEEAEKELHRQGITMDDIPAKGKTVYFSQKTSRGCGGTTKEVTPIVHPDNIEMLEHVARYLGDPLVGVDFILEDITKSWKEEQHSGIIECNSLPFIDLHHYVMFGEPNNVAGKLWDLVMPDSKPKS
ncbi:MAG: ATP-grasp protein [Patescibacteria group bacterium]|nr:ATP-grasp protein [Patescibacteria group bacterium]